MFSVGSKAITTLNPGTGEVTNQVSESSSKGCWYYVSS